MSTRTSMNSDRPTVSIQNGRPISFSISDDIARSTSEKNGFGSAGGSGPAGRICASRLSRARAICSSFELSGSAGPKSRCMSISAAISWVTASDRRKVTNCQWRSMNTRAMAD